MFHMGIWLFNIAATIKAWKVVFVVKLLRNDTLKQKGILSVILTLIKKGVGS